MVRENKKKWIREDERSTDKKPKREREEGTVRFHTLLELCNGVKRGEERHMSTMNKGVAGTPSRKTREREREKARTSEESKTKALYH